MKLIDYKTSYKKNTEQASTLVRQLALAGIAIIWLFRLGEPSDKSQADEIIPKELITSLYFFAIALVVDLLQYFSLSWMWFITYRIREYKLRKKAKDEEELKKLKETKDYANKGYSTIFSWLCFLSKGVLMFLGYYCLLKYLKFI